MDIKAAALISEMQAIKGEMQPPTPPNSIAPQQDFSALLTQAVNNVNGLQQDTDALRTRFELGDDAVSLEQVMIAAQKSSIAFDATVQVRNKVVDAYKTIMNMPV
ncbi:flagellar hook-basal body complex protein FliE [Oceanisphaera psychrotolerans]|uniref:Flagellar hook-basal body complex protein FliE n=1 Tax=Oceanisphaera psychrotolerans TaxID=1414654 RepID=A0A1J4QBF7_9GAMM|nr:flagellar hook-basal body complex protein FliE [Oceanisphaera psychrotolerans]OIN07715.1 flagellar hook-basal body complex protein FliE [Oceanisphaera psychrotolerans]